MRSFPSAACSVALALLGGMAQAAPVPPLDRDPVGFLRSVQSSPSPEAKAARRAIVGGPAALARERAAAQTEGLAVFPAQLNQPLPPDDQNAAPLYLKLDALRRAKPLGLPRYSQPLSARYAYTPEQLARVRQGIDARQDVFALLHQAADRPQCVFARDWTSDARDAPFLRYAWLRESAREIKTESVLLAEEGRYSEAVTSQTRGFRLAEHAASEPTLISYLVAEAIESIAMSGMQDILTLAGPNVPADAQVGRTVSGKPACLSLRHALSGEVASGDADFSRLRRDGPGTLVGLFSFGGSAPRPLATGFTSKERRFYADLLDAAEAEDIQWMRLAIRAADAPEEPAVFVAASLEAQVPPGDLVHEVAGRMSPLQSAIWNVRPVRNAASRLITCAAAAVLAERAKTGVYPTSLPGIFSDPYSGKSLGYRREGAGGFVVYSAGPTGRYDGGRPSDEATAGEARIRYPTVPVPVPPDER